MPRIGSSSVTLRISGDNLDPTEISAALGVEPTFSIRKGAEEIRPSGRIRTAKTGIWNRSVADCDPGDLDRQIADLLSQMTGDLGVWKNLATRFHCEVFCGLFMNEINEGFSISADTLTFLAERDLSIDFDLYGIDSES